MKNRLSLVILFQNLVRLVKNDYSVSSKNNNYYQISESKNLDLISKMTLNRHKNQLDKYCFFTSRFLKSLGQAETELISIIARFEAGLAAINDGQTYEDEFIWPCDPLPVIHALVAGNLSNESIQPGKYRMILSDQIMSTFDVEKVD